MKNFNHSPGQPQPQYQRGMVLLVAKHQTAGPDQRRDVQRIGREPHSQRDGIVDAQELGRQPLQLDVQVAGAVLLSGGAQRHPVLVQRPDGEFRARAGGVGEAEVVVGAEVQALSFVAGESVRANEWLQRTNN